MEVMTLYEFHDKDIERVLMHITETREIVLTKENSGALLLDKNDVIALAKDFNLVVYDKDSSL